MSRVKRRRSQNLRTTRGCGGWLGTCVISLALLYVNVAVTQRLMGQFSPLWEPLRRPRVAQAILLLVPVTLLFIEWACLEWLSARRAARHERDGNALERQRRQR